MGPNLLWHLGGGEGGIRHFMDTLMPQMANALWPVLGNPELTPELQEKIVKGVLEEADGHSIDELAADRDAMLVLDGDAAGRLDRDTVLVGIA